MFAKAFEKDFNVQVKVVDCDWENVSKQDKPIENISLTKGLEPSTKGISELGCGGQGHRPFENVRE